MTGTISFEETDGTQIELKGLGMIPYFMWNVAPNPYNIYYGANFVDYIGHIDSPIVMVKPVNGQCYDSFILAQYFGVSIEGAAAADKITLAAIEAILRLPDTVTLADKALVEAARAAYNSIATNEQRALYDKAGYYEKLTAAEKRIADLEYLQNMNEQPTTSTTPEPTDKISMLTVILIIAGAVLAVAIVAVVILQILRRKKNNIGGDPDGEKGADSDTVSSSEAAPNGNDTDGNDIAQALPEGNDSSEEVGSESEESEKEE